MKKMALATLCGALALVTTTAWSGDEVENPEQVAEYRHQVMEGVGKHMRAASMIVKGEVKSRKGDLVLHAAAMHHASKIVPELFPKGSGPDKAPGSEAKAEIWTDWDGFKAKSKEFEDASATLLEAAEADDLDAFKEAFSGVGKSCKGCHDSFKADDD